MAGTLSIISIISFVAAAICFILAIVFFIVFKIPYVIGDLTGRNARKSIEKMRQNNVSTGDKAYRPSETNKKRGKITETMHGTAKKTAEQMQNERPETGLLSENQAGRIDGNTTDVLIDENATDILVDENETVALNTTAKTIARREGGMRLDTIERVMVIHTDEVIA